MLMPVSALAVLLGSLSGISITGLLMGGFVPGMLLKAAFVAYIIVCVKLNPSLAPAGQLDVYRGWDRIRPLIKYVIPILTIFLVVVTSMNVGWSTPTESAAIGAFATMVLALAYRVLTTEILFASLRGTIMISGMILFIIVGATTFSQILSFPGASNGIGSLITGHGLTQTAIVAGMMLILIFLGIFVDQVSMMLITLPIFMPIVQQLGIDPVWFGVMFLICMQLGLLLPPHGLLLMTMKGVVPPQIRMSHIFRAVVPYILLSVLMLALVFFVPAVALWLPNTVR